MKIRTLNALRKIAEDVEPMGRTAKQQQSAPVVDPETQMLLDENKKRKALANRNTLRFSDPQLLKIFTSNDPFGAKKRTFDLVTSAIANDGRMKLQEEQAGHKNTRELLAGAVKDSKDTKVKLENSLDQLAAYDKQLKSEQDAHATTKSTLKNTEDLLSVSQKNLRDTSDDLAKAEKKNKQQRKSFDDQMLYGSLLDLGLTGTGAAIGYNVDNENKLRNTAIGGLSGLLASIVTRNIYNYMQNNPRLTNKGGEKKPVANV